jgi:phosphate transport system ATP-binding protein
VAASPDAIEVDQPSFPGCVVQLTAGHPARPDAVVTTLQPATIRLAGDRVSASVGETEWSWLFSDLQDVFHGGTEPWTILAVPGVPDHGVAVRPDDSTEFRRCLDELLSRSTGVHNLRAAPPAVEPDLMDLTVEPVVVSRSRTDAVVVDPNPPALPPSEVVVDTLTAVADDTLFDTRPTVDTQTETHFVWPVREAPAAAQDTAARVTEEVHRVDAFDEKAAQWWGEPITSSSTAAVNALAGLEARGISAWFGSHHVLDRVSLQMAAGEVTALIGPSGCGKSTFLRILNRMHEMIPSASLAGEVLLDGMDIYDVSRKLTDARRQIGMVFQKPNPFPAMSIYDNVVAGFRLTGTKTSSDVKDETVETCLRKAGLWNEVRDRLRQPGGSLSGGQQQRLCIARALAIRPRVLLMDEPCSALDPTSTRRIEETIAELVSEVTIVIVTHNMQQAARVSHRCAFFLAAQGTPGVIVEHGPTDAMFHSPQDPRTSDYVNGRFG